ncbi:MAG: transcriptional regulator [Flavobacteriales bacterium]|nr:transcriptional regulator [Flavobacteriales bacterium]MCB9197444.1 transcriptional regulator [Flavobacteriales bacterium]
MKLSDAKLKFIQSWGNFGSQWGINKTMAQIHGFLLVSDDLMSADEIMEFLQISRGNANMNIRSLMDWGLVYKEHQFGERREFFRAEKDIWVVAKRVVKYRHEKELVPMLRLMAELNGTKITEGKQEDILQFQETIGEIDRFAQQADKMLTRMESASENWFWKSLMKIFIK